MPSNGLKLFAANGSHRWRFWVWTLPSIFVVGEMSNVAGCDRASGAEMFRVDGCIGKGSGGRNPVKLCVERSGLLACWSRLGVSRDGPALASQASWLP